MKDGESSVSDRTGLVGKSKGREPYEIILANDRTILTF